MKATVLANLRHNGKRYKVGQKFEASDEIVKGLIADGVLEDPNVKRPGDEESAADAAQTVAAAEAKAKEITDDATKQAQSTADAAKADADKVTEAAKEEAAKIIADAKTKGEEAIKAANVQAAKIVEDAKKASATK